MPIALTNLQLTPVQTGRPFRLTTPLGDDALLLERFTGEERVSHPFLYALDVLAGDPSIAPDDLLGKPASLAMRLTSGERVVHGRVRRVTQLGTQDGVAEYRVELVPWLWFLSLYRDCRIFQHKTVPEIAEDVFRRLGMSDFELRLTGSYHPRDYTVQYRETHLDFVSRLLEDEGIFYFFRHEASKHTLVLADSPGAMRPAWGLSETTVAPAGVHWTDEAIVELRREHAVQTGRVTLSSYDWLKPSQRLRSSVGDEGAEVHDWPGEFLEHAEGDRYARLRLEEQEARREILTGRSTYRAFEAGARFGLADHARPDANQQYVLTSVRHAGDNGAYLAGDAAEARYENAFEAIPADVPYRPSRTTPRPAAYGTQSAVVVGPKGEEIFTDAHGRVKVQFHWDREGKLDENSSCWVRVSTAWAGKGWGQFSVPRIGQEVLVEYMDGDPDQPVIVGRVYNAEQTPPCNPAGGGVSSGLRSKTHKGAGYNAIEMNDTAGKEALDVHAQYDMSTTVLHDETVSIGHDRTDSVTHDETDSVGNDQKLTIGANRTEKVGGNETISIDGSRTRKVGGSETVTVTMARTHSVGINEMINVGGAQEISVGLAQAITVGLAQALTVGAAQTITVKGPQIVSVGAVQTVTVKGSRMDKIGANLTSKVAGNGGYKFGKKLIIDAGDEIVLKTGSASITMKKDGTVVIKGKDITIEGSGKILGKASGKMTLKGSQILQNP